MRQYRNPNIQGGISKCGVFNVIFDKVSFPKTFDLLCSKDEKPHNEQSSFGTVKTTDGELIGSPPVVGWSSLYSEIEATIF